MPKQLRIVVTGGAGFIGSHVVDAYINAGHHVAVIDNMSTGSLQNVNPAAVFYKADIRDALEMQRIMKIEKPTILNHHAAAISVTGSTERPMETYEVNVLGTINVLTAAAPYIRKCIIASTGGAMYANPKKFPATELETPTPISPYGFSKQLAEEAVVFYAKAYDFEYTILRYANVFGPRQNPHGESGIIAIFSSLATLGRQPTIYRRATTRDYVFVGDVARANSAALTQGANEIVNIGRGIEVSNQEVYTAVKKAFGWRVQPIYKPARPGELTRSVLAPAKARRVLGWQPTVTIEEGLRAIHDYAH